MKRIVLTVVLALGVACRASQPADFDLFTIPQITQEKVVAFTDSLSSKMRRVQAMRLLTYGAFAYVSFELVRRTFFSQDSGPVTQKAHDDLASQVKDLKVQREDLDRRVILLENWRPAQAQGWMSWGASRAKSLWKSTSDNVPDILKSVVSGYLLSCAGSALFGHLPSVDGYLGFSPTVNWCMFNGTLFVESMSDFLNWYQAFQAEPGKHFDPQNPEAPLRNLNMKSFALSSHIFVTAMEQVLGYMAYVTSVLDTKDPNYHVLKARSEVCMETITLEATELIEMIKAFLKEEQKSYEVLDGMLRYWQVKMLKIVDQFENFETVALAAGFKEREGRGHFNALKKFIVPQIDSSKPEPVHQPGPIEEVVNDMVSSAQEVASYVKGS